MNKSDLQEHVKQGNHKVVKEAIANGEVFHVEQKIDGVAYHKLLTKEENDNYIENTRQSEIFNNVQLATKILLNSLYGAVGSKYCRFFDIDLAKSVTLSGQDIIKSNSAFVEDYLRNGFFKEKSIKKKYNVDPTELTWDRSINTYIDTDSLYLSYDELMNKLDIDQDFQTRKKFTQNLTTLVVKKLDTFNAEHSIERYNSENKIFWDSELLADTAIFCIKKKYCAHMIEEDGDPCDKMLIKGLEIIRSSTPKKCRKIIKEGVELMLKGVEEDVVDAYCFDMYSEFKKWSYDDIALPKTCKDIKKWKCKEFEFKKSTPQHYKGALAYNHLLEKFGNTDIQPIQSGDKVKMLKLDKNNPYRIDTICYIGELPEEFGIDDRYILKKEHFNLGFVNPMKLLYESLSWKLKDYTNRRQTIEDLFE